MADAQSITLQDTEAQKSSPIISADQRDDQTHDLPHDIFLSHSGAQKGFVKDLYQELWRSTFTTFLDVERHSLQPGDHFPKRILQAAKSCRVALVVLSEEFMCSKWPMVELCTFVDAMMAGKSLRLLPLFFKLCPADLKSKKNLKRWRKAWRAHAKQDAKHRIDVSKWEGAVEMLCSQNGILFEQASEGEQTYIDKIVSAVSVIVPPAFNFDSTFIAGKDRLCQVIVDKFESMQERHQSSTRVHNASSASPTSSGRKVTCVLGLYGLPGSGKSTLCKCLMDHFRPLFGSRNTLYLNFSSTPSHAEVVNKLKELLRLTNFRNRVDLDGASDLENVESLLKSCRLSSCTVFLVVDNISDNTWEAVQRILHLGFGDGSKIVLVSRDLEVLRKTLDSLKDGLHWACRSMAVPSIDESEASEILLRSARSSYGAASDKGTFFKSLTSGQMGTVKHIVHMCSCEDGKVWLPLVMKAVGARLLRYEKGDLEEWGRDLESFWTRVKTYEQSAVIEELLGDNFKALANEHLQLIFLDVALFILHFDGNIDVVSHALSTMHEFSIPRLKMMIQDLNRHCFLTVSQNGIVSVHDVYRKFARGIQDHPSKHVTTSISWRWEVCQKADADLQSVRSLLLQADQGQINKVRALVLEVGESCERVDLQGFSGLKAVGLRDCKSLAVLGLTGLNSLRILEIRHCASFRGLECNDRDFASLRNVRRFSLTKESSAAQEQFAEPVSYFWQPMQPVAKVLKSLIAPFISRPHLLEVGPIISQMTSLQVLNLKNTGIGRLECVGGMWPQLRTLTVFEQHLQGLELGSLPRLEEFHFCDIAEREPGIYRWLHLNYNLYLVNPLPNRSSEIWRRKERDERYLLAGKDLLLGCPQLKRVTVQAAFFRQGQLGSLAAGVVTLKLHHLHTATELPDLSSSAHTLQHLDVLDCEKLERVNLHAGFQSLRTLQLILCVNMVEVNGLGSLPSLRVLTISDSRKLESLKGFENSKMLEELRLCRLRELREISDFSSLGELRLLDLQECPKLATSVAAVAKVHDHHLCDRLGKLTECRATVALAHHLCGVVGSKLTVCVVSIDGIGECCFDLSNCKQLQKFGMYLYDGTTSSSCRAKGKAKVEGLDKLERLRSLWMEVRNSDEREGDDITRAKKCIGLASMVSVELQGKGSVSFDLSNLMAGKIILGYHMNRSLDLTSCKFRDLCNLRSLRGLESLTLVHLEWLEIEKCPVLEEVHSLHGLVHLRHLTIEYCPVLEEVPSLHALVHLEWLEIADCPKLKAVEGCDHMTQLSHADFRGCESMETLPLSDFSKFDRLEGIHFKGCKFARDMEKMAAWAKDEAAPMCLRRKAARALTVGGIVCGEWFSTLFG